MKSLARTLAMAAWWSALTGAAAYVRGEAIRVDVPPRSKPVDFVAEIAPLLRANCIACHNDKKAEARLNLESPQAILRGGEQGPAVVPGKSAESRLLLMAAHEQESIMPPPDNVVGAKPLTPSQLGLLKLWIDQGATGSVSATREITWQPLPRGYQPAFAAAVTPDGQFAVCSRGPRLCVYHLPTGKLAATLADPALVDPALAGAAHRDMVRSLAFDPSGELLASGGFREVKLWRRPRVARSGQWAHDATVRSLAASADGRYVATGDENGRIRIWDSSAGKTTQSISAHQAAVTGIVFAADSVVFTASLDKSLRAWNATDGAPIGKPISLPAPIRAFVSVGRGQWLVAGDEQGTVRIWEAQSLREPAQGEIKPLAELKAHAAAVSALAARSDDAREFFSAGADGLVRRWDAASGKQLGELKHDAPVVALAVSADGSRVASAGDASAKLWDGEGKLLTTLSGDPRLAAVAAKIDADVTFTKSAITRDQQDLKSYEGLIRGVTVKADELKKAEEELTKAKKARDEKNMALEKAKAGKDKVEAAEKAAADAETAVKVAESVVERAKAVAERTTKKLADAQAALAAREELLKKQEAAKSDAAAAAKASQLKVRSLAIATDNARLAVGCEDGAVHLFDVESGTPSQSLADHRGAVQALAFTSPETLVSGSADRQALAWNAPSQWRLQRVIGGLDQPHVLVDRVLSVDFSRDGRWLAAAGGVPSRSGELKIFNVVDGKLVREIKDAHTETVFAVRFSPDGQHLASAGGDRLIKVFDVQSGQAVRRLVGHTSHVLAVSWHADGKLLVSSGADHVVKLWNFESGLFVRTMKGGVFGNRTYKSPVTAVSFIGDSEELLAVSGDGTVRLHRTSSENEIMSFAGSKGYQYSAAATPDGRYVVASSSDGTLRVWSGHDQRIKQSLAP